MIKAKVIYSEDRPITKISLVDKGANMENLVKLAEELPIVKLNFDEDLMEVTGVVLIPEQEIYRGNDFFIKTLGIDEDGYIMFSAEDIKLFNIDYLKNAENSFNLQHKDDVSEDSVQMVESWLITTDNDKAYDMGFDKETVVMGSWIMTQKITDTELWEEIKAGTYNSFSIEGSPIIEQVMLSVELTEDEIVDEIVKIIAEYNKN